MDLINQLDPELFKCINCLWPFNNAVHLAREDCSNCLNPGDHHTYTPNLALLKKGCPTCHRPLQRSPE